MSKSQVESSGNRVMSIDAYRGFVMLAMASSGFGFSALAKPENLQKLADSGSNPFPNWLLKGLAYQFDHVVWAGCGFWDLIQPSFMFLVGVALPFSYSRRESEGQSAAVRFRHVLWRSFVLVALGVFLSSNGSKQTNFTFMNVLSQIGLGYPVLYLFRERSLRTQFVAVVVILVGYWGWFANYTIPPAQFEDVTAAIVERHPNLVKDRVPPDQEWTQFSGTGAHWNKHVNAASDVDRKLLNVFPSEKEPFRGQKFWVNDGGYQTLNFIPSLATMLFGLMAGTVLRSGARDGEKVKWLLTAGAICFGVSMALDTSIWPVSGNTLRAVCLSWTIFYVVLMAIHKFGQHLVGFKFRFDYFGNPRHGAATFGFGLLFLTLAEYFTRSGYDWHFAPIVKRIWTPGWAVFSSGWTFWMLAAFYWAIDIRQWRAWSWPLVIVGMNSIAMYVMAQLIKSWMGGTLKTHLATFDALFGWERGITYTLFGEFSFATPLGHAARLFGLWLICVWLYRRKIFVRV